MVDMNLDGGLIALLVVTAIRIFVPLFIFKNPFWGGVLAIVSDAIDVMVFERFSSGPLSPDYYHNYDKIFDTYYLFLEFLVVRQWTNPLARRTAKGLFYWRFGGFFFFEISSIFGSTFRPFFFLAPNIFENFYLVWTFILRYFPKFTLTKKRLIIIILLVGIPKIIQEAIMHWLYPDQTWYFLRDTIFFWLY